MGTKSNDFNKKLLNALKKQNVTNSYMKLRVIWSKKAGTIYHLYEKPLGAKSQAYFSIMSPEDWGADMPHEFLGSYLLGYDLQFTPIELLTGKRLKQEQVIDQVYDKFTTGGFNMIEGGASFAGVLATLS